MKEEAVKPLVSEVDADLLERVLLEYLESEDVEKPNAGRVLSLCVELLVDDQVEHDCHDTDAPLLSEHAPKSCVWMQIACVYVLWTFSFLVFSW